MPAAREGAARGHGGQTLDAGAAEQLQQQCLGLIEGVMRGQQAFPRL